MTTSNSPLTQGAVGAPDDTRNMPSVRLVAASVPQIPEAGTTAEEFIAYAARVSNPTNQSNHETGARLMAYLRRNQHWSPFEMVSATLEIVTTRDIARQMLRHRSFSFQEFSQRYSSEIEFAEPREARLQDPKNRQNSIEITGTSFIDEGNRLWWQYAQDEVRERAQELYADAIGLGIAKEVARAILPEGLTVSRLYMAGTFRSWLHYVELRGGNGTQKEHRLIADQCRAVLASEFPTVFGGAS